MRSLPKISGRQSTLLATIVLSALLSGCQSGPGDLTAAQDDPVTLGSLVDEPDETNSSGEGNEDNSDSDLQDGLGTPPLADAGASQTVFGGQTVMLDGSASTDSDGDDLDYTWTQTVGPPVSWVGDAAGAIDYFTLDVEVDTQLEFTLSVTDGVYSVEDTVSVTVLALLSAADAGLPDVRFAITLDQESASDLPLDGPAPLSVTCVAATFDGQPLPEGTLTWMFDGVAEAGPTETYATRVHTFTEACVHTIALSLTVGGLTVGCLNSQDLSLEAQAIVWPSVSGKVLDVSGAGISGATVSANAGGTTAVTAFDGSYEVQVPCNWSGDVSVEHIDYQFDPSSRSYIDVSTHLTDEDFEEANAGDDESDAGADGDDAPIEAECTVAADCDDGLFCNGAESCVDEACVNGVACLGLCDEQLDSCVSCLSDADCDDGAFCNGSETCDTAAGVCLDAQVPCADDETCDEALDACTSVACSSDADCDDGIACNGLETCANDACQPGASQCSDPDSPVCDTQNDVCVECINSGDCSAGFYCDEFSSCQPGEQINGTILRGDDSTPATGREITVAALDGAGDTIDSQATTTGAYTLVVPAGFSGTLRASAAAELNVRFDANDLPNNGSTGPDFTAFFDFYVDLAAPDDPSQPSGTQDNPHDTIQDSADEALPGDVINIRPGTYSEHVRVGDGAGPDPEYSGTSARPITYQGVSGDPSDVLLEGWLNGDYYFTNCLEIRADYIIIRDLTIARAKDVGCILKNVHGVLISRCVFLDCRLGGLLVGGEAVGAHDVEVIDCVAYGNGDYGLFVGGSANFAHDTVVRHSVSWNNGWRTPAFAQGIVASWKTASVDGHTERITITECVSFNNGMQIGLQDNIDSTIESCVVWGGLDDGDGNGYKIGLHGYGSGCRLIGNVAFAAPARGIEISNAPGAEVYNNTVFDCGILEGTTRAGLDMDEGVYLNNLVFDNYINSGSYFSYDWRTANSFDQSDYNLWKDSDGILRDMPPNEGTHSLFGDPAVADKAAARAAAANFEIVAQEFEAGTHSLDFLLAEMDDLFTDMAAALVPSSGSIVIDMGTDVGLPFNGSAPDIGAFESP